MNIEFLHNLPKSTSPLSDLFQHTSWCIGPRSNAGYLERPR